ncbi:MAG: helix-turn-helix domain-containing protein [Blautia sp.]|uniref:helix-turn-helix domain-containing protein n=1 Tax=Blautia sp. TaxID=1955243 RepID=UPI0039948982
MDLEQIGLRVKNSRRKKHLTQEKFAELIDVSPHYIYEIERGLKAMSLYTLNNIVVCLDISSDYLLYGDDSPRKTNSPKQSKDKLTLITETLSPQKKNTVADIISVLLPFIK